ncbi:MAG: hypothetical protein JWQ38_3301, partial [Flavipsychrobacter sp.]|nr:hypothetical protein [Flavipsychrobacter sp.]
MLLLALCLTTIHATAQALIPFEFISEEENRFIKENDSCRFYAAIGDSNIVSLNEEGFYYKLLDKAQKVLAEGA